MAPWSVVNTFCNFNNIISAALEVIVHDVEDSYYIICHATRWFWCHKLNTVVLLESLIPSHSDWGVPGPTAFEFGIHAATFFRRDTIDATIFQL